MHLAPNGPSAHAGDTYSGLDLVFSTFDFRRGPKSLFFVLMDGWLSLLGKYIIWSFLWVGGAQIQFSSALRLNIQVSL